MNIGMRLGSIVLGVTFVFSLIAAAWSDAPDFITFVAENRAVFMGIGIGVIASGFVTGLKLVFIIAVVIIVLRLLGV